jgi:hypothetical protein
MPPQKGKTFLNLMNHGFHFCAHVVFFSVGLSLYDIIGVGMGARVGLKVWEGGKNYIYFNTIDQIKKKLIGFIL